MKTFWMLPVVCTMMMFAGCSKTEKDVVGSWTCTAANEYPSTLTLKSDHSGEQQSVHTMPLTWAFDAGTVTLTFSTSGGKEVLTLNAMGKLVSTDGRITCTR